MGGLMDYKARFYSPYLNHFIQPDTIIPDPFNPQAWNRFGYVHSNPINFNDPTGHARCDADGYCGSSNKTNFMSRPKKCNAACKLDLEFEGDWSDGDKLAFTEAALIEANRMYDAYCPEQRRFDCEFSSAEALYRETHGTTVLTFEQSTQSFYCKRNANQGAEGVICYKNSKDNIVSILASHEMGHVFNALIYNNHYPTPYNLMETERSNLNLPGYNEGIPSDYNWHVASFSEYGEDFANMYSVWVFDAFPDTAQGKLRKDFMNKNMPVWIIYMLNKQ